MKTGAVIVAAGMSSRMGDFKPMLQIGTISMVQRIIANFQQAGVFPIVLVTGYRGDELEKHVAKTGVICVRNEDYAHTQMFDSAKIGFSYIMDKCDRTFFCPVDVPLFTVNTIMRLMESDAHLAKPVCGDEDGHPILLSCEILPILMETGSERGLKTAIDKCCDDIQIIQVSDEGVLQDADTPEDYEQLIERHNRQLLRPSIEISLMRENKLFDKTSALLLRMIDYTGTVKGACEKMQISYSKAWNMLSTLEENLGFALIDRRPGGESGGSSQLTTEGKDLLDRYENFAEMVRRYADESFKKCFRGGPPTR
jgi:molybdenum cofactor cytidylyltransferase